jgi:hypothetical protein
MKLKELNSLLIEANELLICKWSQVNHNNKTHIKFEHLKKFRKGLNIIAKTELFKNEINTLRASAIFTNVQDTLNVLHSEGVPLSNVIDNFQKIVVSLNDTLFDISGEPSEHSVSIKLPETRDFEDLSKSSQILHKIFNQSICNEHIKGQVNIENVENGSIWLDVGLNSGAAVALIGSLTWSAAVVYKKIQEGRLIAQHVKGLGIKNDSLKEIQKKQAEALDLIIDAEGQQLYKENFEGDNNEQIERLKHSVKLLSELIDKGAEIHPALNQPEKVTNLFPDMKNLPLVESKIKSLKE